MGGGQGRAPESTAAGGLVQRAGLSPQVLWALAGAAGADLVPIRTVLCACFQKLQIRGMSHQRPVHDALPLSERRSASLPISLPATELRHASIEQYVCLEQRQREEQRESMVNVEEDCVRRL
jgi:hypothetical protein